MRTRDKSYEDYGIKDNEIDYIKQFCIKSNAEQQEQIVKIALSELGPYIALKCLDSLVNNKSYEDLCKEEYLCVGKNDFYGYRRKGMAAIKRWMQLYNIWKYEI
jgi:hypothetical protein